SQRLSAGTASQRRSSGRARPAPTRPVARRPPRSPCCREKLAASRCPLKGSGAHIVATTPSTLEGGMPMSALGHKQTYAVQKAMSASPLIATAKADLRKKRTCAAQQVMSALGQKRTFISPAHNRSDVELIVLARSLDRRLIVLQTATLARKFPTSPCRFVAASSTDFDAVKTVSADCFVWVAALATLRNTISI